VRKTRALSDLLDRLERRKQVNYVRVFERLAEIVDRGEPGDAIRAAQVLLGYRFGGPRVSASITYDTGPNVMEILREIAEERKRRALPSGTTVEVIP
jgi:hypothetical protein